MASTVSKRTGLTQMQTLFVAAYLSNGGSQKKAAIAAGCSEKSASVTASKWMATPAVLKAVETQQLAVLRKANIDARWVLEQAVEIYRRVTQEISPALHPKTRQQLKDEDGHPLYTFNSASALRALELVGKHVEVGAFAERIELTGGLTLVERLQAGRARAHARAIDVTPTQRPIEPEVSGDIEGEGFAN